MLRKHCRAYLKILKAWKDSNLHPYYIHRRADAEASRLHRITGEERKQRDREWLDVRYPGWNREPEADKGPGLFDDVMHVD